MSFSGRRRFPVRRPAVVDMGCSCRGKKLSSLFAASLTFLKRKPKPYCAPVAPHQPLFSYHHSSSSSSSTATAAATSPWETSHHPSSSLSTATTTSSLHGDDPSSSSSYLHSALRRKDTACDPAPSWGVGGGKKAWVGDSVAVVKESEDPYVDFRESMLQMILEKEIYAWEDLLELLHSFLALNAPCHHDLILRAFGEIYGGMASSSPTGRYSGAAAHITRGRRRRRHHGGGGRTPRQL